MTTADVISVPFQGAIGVVCAMGVDRITVLYVARNLMSIEICAPARLLGQEMLVRFEADGPEGEPRRCQRLTKELWADIWNQVLRMELDYWAGKLSQDKAQIVADRIKSIREFFQREFT